MTLFEHLIRASDGKANQEDSSEVKVINVHGSKSLNIGEHVFLLTFVVTAFCVQ